MGLLRGHDPKSYEGILRDHSIYDYRAILQAMEFLKREKEMETGKVVRWGNPVEHDNNDEIITLLLRVWWVWAKKYCYSQVGMGTENRY